MNLDTLSRRRFLRLAAAGGAVGAVTLTGHGRPAPDAAPADDLVTPDAQAAIDGGLRYLARVQHDDGSFGASPGSAVGVAALAGLALMAGGHQPGRGQYGRAVSKAVDYVLAAGGGPVPGLLASPDGGPRGFGGQNPQPSYSHGFACLFLAEVCGMLPDPARQKKVRAVLEQAVGYTVDGRNREGGWRYEPRPAYADVSVTVAQMMALRAARNAGVGVPKRVVDAGAAYIRSLQQRDGGFAYSKQHQQHSAFPRSAAAVVGLYSAGVYAGPEVERGLQYVYQFLPVRQFSDREIYPQHWYYGHYYAALAMWTAGGDLWAAWFPAIRDQLLGRVRAGGGNWTDGAHGSPYATAMSLIILQLPNNYLPILQK